MPKDGRLLLHGPTTCLLAGSHGLREAAARLDEGTAYWRQKLVTRTSMAAQDIADVLESGADYVLTAGQALELNLVDALL
jgi:ATP-dependent protease ClpP protease subunit